MLVQDAVGMSMLTASGHKYLTVVADHDTGDRAWIGEGLTKKTMGAFFDELGSRGAEQGDRRGGLRPARRRRGRNLHSCRRP